jgi:hypothetical protein
VINAPTVVVRIPHDKFYNLAKGHPIHHNISVIKELRDKGVPVDGGLELRGVTAGRLSMWNEYERGVGRVCVYEWTPPDEDEDL